MAEASLCPVCKGKGIYVSGPYFVTYMKCHGCGGRGWVTVQETDDRQREPQPQHNYPNGHWSIC